MYRFSKSGRLFVQGTREQDDRDNVAGSSPTSGPELQAVHTKRHMSTEILGIKGYHKMSREFFAVHLSRINFEKKKNGVD